MSPGKKECLGCFELINEKAHKCPHCQQIQSKLYTTQYNKWGMVALALGLFAFMGYLVYEEASVSKIRNTSGILSVDSNELYSRTVEGKEFVSCSGILSNASSRDARDIDLRADFFNEKGALIDTLAVRTNLRIHKDAKSNYRVRGEADKPLSEYRSCKVVVTDQWIER